MQNQDNDTHESNQNDPARIAAALLLWPNMQPYAATARVETLTVTLPLPGGVLARGEVVTVTCFEKKGERELEQNCYLTNSTSSGTI